MRRLLILTIHPTEVASTRYRVAAYIPQLERAGFRVTFVPFLSSEALARAARPGPRQVWEVLRGLGRVWRVLQRGTYDVIMIHRELFPFNVRWGTQVLCRRIRRLGIPVVYDFDDAIYLRHRQGRGLLSWMEDPRSIHDLFALSRLVIAGNEQLAAYARRQHPWVEVMATPVDTEQFTPKTGPSAGPLTIGWIGSPSTAKYLEELRGVFQQLKDRHAFRIKIVGAGRPIQFDGVATETKAWRLQTEQEEFRSCDIGVYPLWDDEWSRGKCGFKALEFMASGVPVVASAVGVNRDIVEDGANGFLIARREEWVEKLSRLLSEPQLRQRMGQAGRTLVESRYSLQRSGERLVACVNRVMEGSRTS